jgi:hypothetical protein
MRYRRRAGTARACGASPAGQLRRAAAAAAPGIRSRDRAPDCRGGGAEFAAARAARAFVAGRLCLCYGAWASRRRPIPKWAPQNDGG